MQATVRIPCPVVGNVERTIASEVATMCYVRDRWGENIPESMPLPPKVLDWNASYDNPAATPYIVSEYAQGVPLEQRWHLIEGQAAGAALQSIAQLESRLLHEPFSQHGSLYFTKDVSDEFLSNALYTDEGDPIDVALRAKLSDKYCIGPSVNREWWRGEYGHVDANRGPCKFAQPLNALYRTLTQQRL